MTPVAALLLAALSPVAHGVDTHVEGFAELRGQWSAGVDGQQLLMVERFRPTFEASLSKRVALSSTIEVNLSQGRRTQTELQRVLENSDLGPMLEAGQCEWPTPDNELLWTDEASDYVYVDRLYMDVYLPKADIRVGRQALQWGSALMVNPTDPFPQVLLLTPWLPRAGVNSAKVSLPLGEAGLIQAAVGADDDFQGLRSALRTTVNVLETDWSLVGAWRQDARNGVVGVDINGTLGVGFWLEGAVHLDASDRHTDPYEELAVGLDYSLPVLEMMTLAAQYYRNGSGTTEPAGGGAMGGLTDAVEMPTCTGIDLGDALGGGSATPDPFAPVFGGKNYLMAVMSLGISPEVGLSGAWVQNLDDASGMVVPTISAFPLEWLEVTAAAQVPITFTGESGELRPSGDDLVLTDPSGALSIDFSGMVPSTTFLVWSRFSF